MYLSCRAAKHTEGLWVLHGLLAVSSTNAPWLVFDRTPLCHFPDSSTQNTGCTLGLAHVQLFCSSWFWLCSSSNVSAFQRQLLKDCSGLCSHSCGWCHISHSRAGSWGPWRPLRCCCSQWKFPILKTGIPYLISYTWIYLWTHYFTSNNLNKIICFNFFFLYFHSGWSLEYFYNPKKMSGFAG